MKVINGKGADGKDCEFYIDGKLAKALDIALKRSKKGWDYVCVVAGLPGSGKSTFARTIGKYCSPWFDNSYIAFTDEEFLKITNECPMYSAVVLDESFQSLNSKVTLSPQFLKIINHLQIIRQKRLFIILCLPNFFDLSKGIAVFRTSHLFVTYGTIEGRRGRFMAFGRSSKRRLYVLGSKFMDYDCVRANFTGRYAMNNNILNMEEYERRKLSHLLEQETELKKKTDKPDGKTMARLKDERVAKNIMKNLALRGYKQVEISELAEIPRKTVADWMKSMDLDKLKAQQLNEKKEKPIEIRENH